MLMIHRVQTLTLLNIEIKSAFFKKKYILRNDSWKNEYFFTVADRVLSLNKFEKCGVKLSFTVFSNTYLLKSFHAVNQFLMSTYYVPGSALGSDKILMKNEQDI